MIATGIGSLPGESFAEAVKVVLGELPDLPHVPELPARGATADLTGRTLAVVTGLDADLQPAGWRLTGSSGSPGLDHRRARSLLAQDLDTVEELTQGYAGAFKAQLAGPWTLAASVERPRGDRILADHGARRELAQALAEGVREHVRDLRRRLPDADRLIVQVDEPGLASVLAGRVPTASGYGRHRSVDAPEASEALEWVFAAVADEGAEPWVHSCAPDTPLGLLRPRRAGRGARGRGDGRAGRRTVPGAGRRGHRQARRRAGAALARHGRARPRRGRRPPAGHADVRPGRRHVDVGAPGPRAGARQRDLGGWRRRRPAPLTGGAPGQGWAGGGAATGPHPSTEEGTCPT